MAMGRCLDANVETPPENLWPYSRLGPEEYHIPLYPFILGFWEYRTVKEAKKSNIRLINKDFFNIVSGSGYIRKYNFF